MDRPLKVAHVCSTSEISGANRYVFDLAEEQIRQGCEATVCVPRKPGDSLAFAKPGLPLRTFGGIYAWSMNRAVARCKADIVHCHGGKAARWLRYMPNRPPSVITIHSRYKPKTMSHLDALIYISEWQANMVSAFDGPKVHIPNWVPQIAPRSNDDIQAFRRETGAAPADFLLGFIGRHVVAKGADLLIRAFRQISSAQIKLVILGSGEETERLKALAAGDDRIRFLGNVANPSGFYQACDLVVIPSRHEPFGLVALEAMAAGAPVLANDTQGLAETLRDYPDSRINAEDITALATRISAYTSQKSGDAILRQSYDISRFDRDKSVAAIIDVYKSMMAPQTAAGSEER